MKAHPTVHAVLGAAARVLPLLLAYLVATAFSEALSTLQRAWVGTFALCIYLALSWLSHTHMKKRLGTVASILTGYREGDFLTRMRSAPDSLLGEVFSECNQLGETLRTHRLSELEAWALLRKVMAEVDVIVLAFDERGLVRLANAAASAFLGKPQAFLVGASATTLGIEDLLTGDAPRTVKNIRSPSPSGAPSDLFGKMHGNALELRRGGFRLSGVPHTLVVLSDLSAALRTHEREAWQRLIRVMGHEINNSLAPIQSIAESLQKLAGQTPPPVDLADDLHSGLQVIERRARGLNRFMSGYAALAKLPAPTFATLNIVPCIQKIAELERRLQVQVFAVHSVMMIHADMDQLEQALINLLRNAADASLERGIEGKVHVRCDMQDTDVTMTISDDGPGLSDTANLFVPFFTTKPQGSGIGLVLAQAIIEAHKGELRLASRSDGLGAVATIRLPRTR